jgi:UDP-N-acetylmuramyl pentapeptide phosphotransferase/UDP-N-acetylglucosamine-1-phosphate transferase
MQSPPATSEAPLFPSFDALETVLWPGAALAVFVITAVLVDVMIVIAARWRLVDLPNRRSAHSLPTARGGGVAIVLLTTLAAITVVLRWPPDAVRVVCGVCLPCLAIAGVGILDDMRPLDAKLRLAIQVGVAVTMTAVLGPITAIALPGLPRIELGLVGWPLTVLWVVGMTNAFNFMDGSDGMAATAAVVAGSGLAAIGLLTGCNMPLLLAAFAAAASGGFLVFNWQPARIFMGDVGSAFLGTFLAAIPLLFPPSKRPDVLVPAVLCLWPVIFDPFVTVIRRIASGANPLVPHREFFFHRLVRGGVTHASVAFLYGALAAAGVLAGLVMLVPALPLTVRACVPLVAVGLAGWLAWTAESIFAASAAGRAAAAPAPPQAAASTAE